jgi:D-alanyl-D-alanine carboxypeptidase/D-alanyl-D-alanine-endopeptidase (penicillin-binding protein 4)
VHFRRADRIFTSQVVFLPPDAQISCEVGGPPPGVPGRTTGRCSSQNASQVTPLRALRVALRRDLRRVGGASGAYVVDLNTRKVLFAEHVDVGRLPASVQKLYTTSTVLLRFGPSTRLTTSVLGRGWLDGRGVWHGTLYLRGGGDPTFGWAGFDRAYYGQGGSTVQALVASLISQSRITGVRGTIEGDESYFDSLRSTVESNYRPDIYMEGELSALAFDRGFANRSGSAYQSNPPLHAARQFAIALRRAGIKVPADTRIRTGRTPAQARLLGTEQSPDMATLLQLTNTPSDNFLAEMLLKGLGARFGSGGTTAAGVSVVRSEISRRFHIHPRFDDGSGLSYHDSTTPRQVVRVLTDMAANQVFVQSLAVGGETGTLADEMQDTPAQGNCRGKTGTLSDVANLAGYCLARDGHTLVFAFLVNETSNPDYVHSVEGNQMAVALAKYDG